MSKRRRTKPMSAGLRIFLIVSADLLAFGICLCTFAYFHHVRLPEVEAKDLGTLSNLPVAAATPEPEIIEEDQDPVEDTDPNGGENADSHAETTPVMPEESEGDEAEQPAPAEPTEGTEPAPAEPAEGTEAAPAEQPAPAEQAEEPAPAEEPLPAEPVTLSNTPATAIPPLSGCDPTRLLGDRFAEKFTADGSVTKDASAYRSGDLCVEFKEERLYDSLIHVADVYMQNINSFKTVVCFTELKEKKTTAQLYKNYYKDAVVITSSDQFGNRSRDQWGMVISNGMAQADNPAIYDFCVLFSDGVMEVFKKGTVSLQDVAARGSVQSWTFGPALVCGGQACTDFSGTTARNANKNPRMAIGYFEPGHYVLVMADGSRGSKSNSEGLTYEELAEYMQSLGCTTAYNLDGGDTASMLWDGKSLSGNRTLTNAIYIAEP